MEAADKSEAAKGYRDIDGVLYSARGLRFGGFPTVQFLEATETLEAKHPGIRKWIISSAHYLILWQNYVPEIVFLTVVLFTHSLALPAALAFVASFIEVFRFYNLGEVPFIPYFARCWSILRWPAYLVPIVAFYNSHLLTGIIASIVCATQLPMIGVTFFSRIIAIRIKFGAPPVLDPHLANLANIESTALNFVINYRKLLHDPTKQPAKLSAMAAAVLGIFAGVAGGLARHYFGGGKLSLSVLCFISFILLAGWKDTTKYVALIVFAIVSVGLPVLLSWW